MRPCHCWQAHGCCALLPAHGEARWPTTCVGHALHHDALYGAAPGRILGSGTAWQGPPLSASACVRPSPMHGTLCTGGCPNGPASVEAPQGSFAAKKDTNGLVTFTWSKPQTVPDASPLYGFYMAAMEMPATTLRVSLTRPSPETAKPKTARTPSCLAAVTLAGGRAAGATCAGASVQSPCMGRIAHKRKL
jgi:hypothetical protein